MAAYQEMTEQADWQRLLERSEEEPVLIFKHSTQCPISAAAWKEFEKFAAKTAERGGVTNAFVKVIESRPVSNQIAEDLDVKHESPQAILLKNRRAVWSASHYQITADVLEQQLAAL